ncbi:MAG: hypothetical protein M0Z31_12645 [Clostridia bacterium]|nr:hypothetical protein [Clostridia bacterium]
MKKRSDCTERIKNIEAEKVELFQLIDPEERELLKGKIPLRNIEGNNSIHEEAEENRTELIEGLAKARRSNKEMKALLRDIQSIVESLANGEIGDFNLDRPVQEKQPGSIQNVSVQGDSLANLLKSPLFQQLAFRIISFLLNSKGK